MNILFKLFFYLIAISPLYILVDSHMYKDFGEWSINLLLFIMFIRPLRDILKSDIFKKFIPKIDLLLKLLTKIINKRKELGIIVGTFAVGHSLGYFIDFNQSLSLIFNPNIWYLQSYLAWGIVSFIVTIPLLLTSNLFSVKLFGKNWKRLHILAYAMLVTALVHKALIHQREFVGQMVLIGFYVSILVWAFVLNKLRLKKSKTIKYVCVPCGWIYDESVGDPDSGIEPGTKFEDIPDDWRCPVCGVGKGDFEKITGEIVNYFIVGDVRKIEYINENKDVIELVLNLEHHISEKEGQFMTFNFSDDNGTFSRSYSISENNDGNLTFLIKVLEDGRAGKQFTKMKVGDKLNLKGPFGEFYLKDSKNKKVFIATGTGLAPVYNMISSLKNKSNFELYFGVTDKSSLFYVDKLKSISNLKTNIFLSREADFQKTNSSINYFNSRINTSYINIVDLDTEFYICGNEKMINEVSFGLKEKGFKNIYFEKF